MISVFQNLKIQKKKRVGTNDLNLNTEIMLRVAPQLVNKNEK